jgi:hypothetical protein
MAGSVISTTTIKSVLTAWSENFMLDVKASHTGDGSFIKYEDLSEYFETLSYGDLVDIMFEMEVKDFRDPIESN